MQVQSITLHVYTCTCICTSRESIDNFIWEFGCGLDSCVEEEIDDSKSSYRKGLYTYIHENKVCTEQSRNGGQLLRAVWPSSAHVRTGHTLYMYTNIRILKRML